MAPTVKTINPAGMAKPYYAAGTTTTSANTLHVAGQVGITVAGKVPSDYVSQIHLALLNLRRVITTAGASVSDILQMNIYIVNYDHKKRLHTPIIQNFLGTHRPAMTLVPVSQLAMPEYLFEVDAVVVTPQSIPASPKPTSAPKKVYDALVVGAGLSGLSAATELRKAGLSFLVVEARDRVGGKTWSKKLEKSGIVTEIGAAWTNDVNQARMTAMAKRFNLKMTEQNTTGDCVFQGYDGATHTFAYGDLPKFDTKTQESVAYIRDLCQADCLTLDAHNPTHPEWDSMSFEAYLRKNGASDAAFETASIWTRAMLGQEPRNVSALYFLYYCRAGGGLLTMRSDRKGGGQHIRFLDGTQGFSIGLASELPSDSVKLNTQVIAVTQIKPSLVEIETTTGTVHAKKVILSLAGTCYKSINFTPALPYQHSILFDSAQYGYYTKAMIVFKSAFWTRTGKCGLVQSFSGPAAVIRDTSVPENNKYAITCFLGGDPGRAWASLPDSERVQALLKQVGEVYADKDLELVKKEYIEHVWSEWDSDDLAGRGCPCITLPPGVLEAEGRALGKPVGDLHFVGTETSTVWKGYMEGAVLSGERGAAEVIAAIGKPVAAKL